MFTQDDIVIVDTQYLVLAFFDLREWILLFMSWRKTVSKRLKAIGEHGCFTSKSIRIFSSERREIVIVDLNHICVRNYFNITIQRQRFFPRLHRLHQDLWKLWFRIISICFNSLF